MADFSIELTLNGPEDKKKTYRRSFVPFRLLKEAVKIQKLAGQLGEEMSFDEETVDNLADFVVAFYGDQFTREELLNSAELSEVMGVFNQIVSRIGNPNPNPPPAA
ncbi:MAG: phage tail assembly chaperone G [Anaerolineaceae bacterium]|jgi:hypothetical protein